MFETVTLHQRKDWRASPWGVQGGGRSPAEAPGFSGLVLAVGEREMGWSSEGRLGVAAALQSPANTNPPCSHRASAQTVSILLNHLFCIGNQKYFSWFSFHYSSNCIAINMNSDFILIYIQRLDKCANCYEKGEKMCAWLPTLRIVNESLDLAL